MILEQPWLLATCSVLAGLLFVGVSFARYGRLDRSDAGALFVALGSGFAVPKGLFLCAYFLYPDPLNVPTKLHGYEKEIFAAGVLVVFLALASLWSICEKQAVPKS